VPSISLLHGNKILIGASLAKLLQISIQDAITILYSPDEPKKRTLTFYTEQAAIGGIFKTGIDEFDTNIVYCSQSFFENLFPNEEISEVSIKLKDLHN